MVFDRSTADLTALETEVAADPVAPLVGEGFAIDEDQSGCGSRFDCRAGDHRLSGTRWRDKDAGVLFKELAQCAGLHRAQRRPAAELVVLAGDALVIYA